MKTIFKIGILLLLLGGLMLFFTVITFAYRGSYNRFIVDLGEISIVLWVPLILIGVFLIVAGAFIDKD